MLMVRSISDLSSDEFADAARQLTYKPPSETLWIETLERLEIVTAERDQLRTERNAVNAALDAWENAPLPGAQTAAESQPAPAAAKDFGQTVVLLFEVVQ